MRKLSCLAVLLVVASSPTTQAQRILPPIKQGTVIKYTFQLHEQQVGFELSVKSLRDTLLLGWRIRNLAGGGYRVLPAALQKADKMNFTQPVPNVVVQLPPDQTFCMISKSAFQSLLRQHQFVYDNTVYDFKDDSQSKPVLLENKPLDVLHAVARNETTELWILNNPDFPLVCQIKGNPLGIDFYLNAIQ